MKILIVKSQFFHADEQRDIHKEAILRKRLKIWIKVRCSLYVGKESAKYVLISSACRK